MDIRELAPDDRAAAVALWDRAGLTRPWNPPEADFDRALASPTSVVLGGFDGGRLVATAMVGHDGHRGWVYYLAVHPDARRSRHASSMMAAAEAWVAAAGVPKIQLMVRTDNADAMAFYRALGYESQDVVVLGRWFDRPDVS